MGCVRDVPVPVEVELETETGEIMDLHIVDEKLEWPIGYLLVEERLIQFPVTKSAKDFEEEIRRRLSLAGHSSADFIRSRQPWYFVDQASGLDADRDGSEIRHHELSTVAWLSNTDKHRRVHLTAWYPTDIWMAVPDGVAVRWRPGRGEWRDGTEIGRWLVTGPSAESVELGDNADVGLTLRHHLDLGWPEVDVVGFLEGCSGTYATASSRPWRMRSAAGSALLW